MTPTDRWLVGLTVLLEAEGEGPTGMQAVAHVILNRMRVWQQDVSTVCLKRQQFSCWNHDQDRRLAISRLTQGVTWQQALQAVDTALTGEDMTKGALNYLNESVTRALRPQHDLPGWFHEANVTVRLGRHTFLR